MQPHGPHAGAGQGTGVATVRQDQFGGAAADVQDQVGLLAESHAREDAEVDQPGLLRAADQVHLQAQLLLHRLQELAAVGRLTHGAGGGGEDVAELDAMAGGQLAAVAQGDEGPLDRLRAEVAGVGIALPRRVADFSVSTTEKLRSPGSTAATSRWIELVPMSMAATGRCPLAGAALLGVTVTRPTTRRWRPLCHRWVVASAAQWAT